MSTSWLDMSAQGVSAADAERQLESAELITRMLERRPGFVLADEVGMGKTYVTFGHIALRADESRRFRALVVAPSSELARKWGRDLLDFCEKPSVIARDLVSRLQPHLALSTAELTTKRGAGVLITTVSAIVGGLRAAPKWERGWLFEAALHRSRRRASTRVRLARRFGILAHDRRNASNCQRSREFPSFDHGNSPPLGDREPRLNRGELGRAGATRCCFRRCCGHRWVRARGGTDAADQSSCVGGSGD